MARWGTASKIAWTATLALVTIPAFASTGLGGAESSICPFPEGDVVACVHDLGASQPLGLFPIDPHAAAVHVYVYEFAFPTDPNARLILSCAVFVDAWGDVDPCVGAGGRRTQEVAAPLGVFYVLPDVTRTDGLDGIVRRHLPVGAEPVLVPGRLDLLAGGSGVEDVPVWLVCASPGCA